MTSPQETAVGQSAGRVGKVFMLLAGAVSVASLGAAVFFYTEYRQAVREKGPQQDELVAVLGKVEKLMELPAGETPTLATVADKEKLSEQSFFKNAENGDKILIYTESGRAILYRPSTGKIVDVTAVNIQNEAAPAETSVPEETPAAPEAEPVTEEIAPEAALPTGPAQVVFLNGSTKVGVTQTAEEKLVAAYPEGVVVMAKEKAAKSDYTGILVADVTGRTTSRASEIATTLGGTVTALPAGETAPDGADIVVIIGNAAAQTVTQQ